MKKKKKKKMYVRNGYCIWMWAILILLIHVETSNDIPFHRVS